MGRYRGDMPLRVLAHLRVEGGGLAYNFTLLALCHRAVELRGRLKAPGATCQPLADGLPEARATRRWPHWYPPKLREAAMAAQEVRRRGGEMGDGFSASGSLRPPGG